MNDHLDDILSGKYGTAENPAPGSFIESVIGYDDYTLVDWASYDESMWQWRSKTSSWRPEQWCSETIDVEEARRLLRFALFNSYKDKPDAVRELVFKALLVLGEKDLTS